MALPSLINLDLYSSPERGPAPWNLSSYWQEKQSSADMQSEDAEEREGRRRALLQAPPGMGMQGSFSRHLLGGAGSGFFGIEELPLGIRLTKPLKPVPLLLNESHPAYAEEPEPPEETVDIDGPENFEVRSII